MLPDFYPELVARIRSRLVPDPARAACLIFPQKRGKHTRIKFLGKLYSPHRVIAEWNAGELFARNIDACHTCDNPRCCRDEHLFKGTRRDNMLDAIAKGRARVPDRLRRSRRKLTDDDVRAVRMAAREGQSARGLARLYHVNHKCINELLAGKRYADVLDQLGPVQVPLLPSLARTATRGRP